MKHTNLLFILLFVTVFASAQTVTDKLKLAIDKMLADPTLKHASMSLYVLNSKTNEVVYDYNSQVGLMPASSQKIITSVTAFELLGNDFKFKTTLGYKGFIKNGTLNGTLMINGSGDPTMASWRYSSSKDTTILNNWMEAIKQLGIKKINGDVILNTDSFPYQPVAGGWPWEDIGNYYGAGCWGLNWHENQFDLTLLPGSNDSEQSCIAAIKPNLPKCTLINKVKTGKADSERDAYIYLAPYSSVGLVYGSIPAKGKPYTISGAMPNPMYQMSEAIESALKFANIKFNKITNSIDYQKSGDTLPKLDSVFNTYLSPTLDSINYWFLKKSVNLYGESLLKTIAYSKTGEGSTEKGIKLVKQFWQDKGIDKGSLRMMDGSGLSPSNRLTTNALVTALQYARDKPWYASFENAFPLYNGMKLKSGTMGGVKAFAGYHTNKEGTDFTVAMIVNDYEGTSSDVTQKMFQVLDELK